MMTTTCLIGLGIVPEVVVTDVSVPVLVYLVVKVPEMLVMVSVGVGLEVDVVVEIAVVIEVVVLVIWKIRNRQLQSRRGVAATRSASDLLAALFVYLRRLADMIFSR